MSRCVGRRLVCEVGVVLFLILLVSVSFFVGWVLRVCKACQKRDVRKGVDLFGKDVPHNDNEDKRERRNGSKRQSVYVLVLLGRRRGEYERGMTYVG